MANVKILDCTLRDGGYVNNWNFGFENIKILVSELVNSQVDIIETGYLSIDRSKDKNSTQFSGVGDIDSILPDCMENSDVAAMVNCGEFNVDFLPERNNTSLNIVRVAFHKSQIGEALVLCADIMKKGYKVFVQPMASMSYSDMEFISMIERVNELMPNAFYIVDSHGSMRKKDMERYYNLADNNLNIHIALGFHSHNNLQLSYSNAQQFVSKSTDRDLIVDSSIYGMGRGAGNLNTELYIGYLNNTFHTKYRVEPILRAIDSTIENIYSKKPWGYSLPYYMSAIHKCHPNYASFLGNKQTLTFKDMNEIFSRISLDKKEIFDEKYIEALYIDYFSTKDICCNSFSDFEVLFGNKTVVIVAPGKSIADSKNVEEILEKISQEKSVTVSLNHISEQVKCDFVFVSNMRRYKMIENRHCRNLIITSNIRTNIDVALRADYSELINDVDGVEDNAALMFIRLLIASGAKEIWLAGVDGYVKSEQNFVKEDLESFDRKIDYDKRNKGLAEMIKRYSAKIPIGFLTETRLNISETDGLLK